MPGSFGQLDALLRGQVTSPENLAGGRLKLSLRRFVPLAALLGIAYGSFMGWYALSLYWGGTTPEPERLWQVLASSIKLPMLFLLTLVVTFPSLYVFNALFGGRAGFVDTLRLLVGAVTVNLAVAASLGPILGFFTLSTKSYPFMVLLNVALLSIAGFVALGFLLQTLRRLAPPFVETRPPEPSPEKPMQDSNDLDPREIGVLTESAGQSKPSTSAVPASQHRQTQRIFQVWVIIYALVGSQMGWILRPFIGNPNTPFQWFRPRSGNFFQAVLASLNHLLSVN